MASVVAASSSQRLPDIIIRDVRSTSGKEPEPGHMRSRRHVISESRYTTSRDVTPVAAAPSVRKFPDIIIRGEIPPQEALNVLGTRRFRFRRQLGDQRYEQVYDERWAEDVLEGNEYFIWKQQSDTS